MSCSLVTRSRNTLVFAITLLCGALPALAHADCKKFCGARDQMASMPHRAVSAMSDAELFAAAANLAAAATPLSQRLHSAQWLHDIDAAARAAATHVPGLTDWLDALDEEVFRFKRMQPATGGYGVEISQRAMVLQLQKSF